MDSTSVFNYRIPRRLPRSPSTPTHNLTRHPRSRVCASSLACFRLYSHDMPTVYHYETLNEHDFQKLAQALIVAKFPDAQCLPVGQPDGGRDAMRYHPSSEARKFTVFQVKYTRDPQSKASRDTIIDLIASEKPKVDELIQRGASRYILITNVKGSSHLDVGSIDKGIETLTNAFRIPSQIWWRDDLDRRLDNEIDIGWRFPEVLRATDILPLLIARPGERQESSSTLAITSYIASQYRDDREIKFKQVELKRSLIDLFVDLPIRLKRHRQGRDRTHAARQIVESGDSDSYLRRLDASEEFGPGEDASEDGSRLAAAFFLGFPLRSNATRIVLEGAPGQGKSTVTQFLCQINRMRLLRRKQELEHVAGEYKSGPVRTPFRLDLRHYAEWLNGRHPFSTERGMQEAIDPRGSLEGFIAMQVGWEGGSSEITQDGLVRLLERSHCLIVLDGFDEVADVATRARLVDEIGGASARLEAHARSVQIIVTSRPAAFANSPGFPQSEWAHVELMDLGVGDILSYKDKWTLAQGLSLEEKRAVSSTLQAKMEQPHLRDLARNPMQLSILLHLIHVQGVALPEKRTTLYEEYMKLFFNREAEKSPVVRDHRELMMAIHGVLAWELQIQVEEGKGTGSFSREALEVEVKRYLEAEEHDSNLVDPLLTGAVERVGALVSRVVGTFEFEVQPLREYFAARHLYTTAPYSPPGNPRSGTRPERFDALVRSSYWTNVTRFFCGFYDVGELGTLVDGLLDLDDEPRYRLVNQPRRIATMLLSDHVFSQSPKTVKRLTIYITNEPGFERLTASDSGPALGLPATAGRDELFRHCLRRIQTEGDAGRRHVLRSIAAANADHKTLIEIWTQRRGDQETTYDNFLEAMDYSILEQFSSEEIEAFTADNFDLRMRWFAFIGRYQEIVESGTLQRVAHESFFDGTMVFLQSPRPKIGRTPIETLSLLLNVYGLSRLDKMERVEGSVASVMHRYFGISDWRIPDCEGSRNQSDDRFSEFYRFVLDHMNSDVSEWRKGIDRWESLVDRGLEVCSGGFLFAQIAVVSTMMDVGQRLGTWDDDGFSVTAGLVGRLHYALEKASDTSWWNDSLAFAKSESSVLGLAVLLTWGDGKTLRQLMPRCELLIESLDEREWHRLLRLIQIARFSGKNRRPEIAEEWFRDLEDELRSARLATMLIGRMADDEVRRRLARRFLSGYSGSDPAIIQEAADIEVMSNPKGAQKVDWEYVSDLSKLGRRAGMPYLFSMQWPDRDWHVAESVAEDVLSSCQLHTGQFVAMCERTYSTVVAGRARRVSAVAADDGWFTP